MNNNNFYQNSIFWVELDKIKPNPFQPRREFDAVSMQALADSIKQYGVLQALVVTRKEVPKDDGLAVEYELIAGERRLRASRIAGLSQVPVIIRNSEADNKTGDDLMKLELAIIENVQREDLNPVERARAFKKLADSFGFKHHQIAQKIGKSRVYVTNTMRILELPEEMLVALSEGKINEGHTRPLLMLIERPEEQRVLFQDIMIRKMNVREAETAARRIAIERVRRVKSDIDPALSDLEEKFAQSLGTRVHIEKRENGGKLTIEFFSDSDLEDIFNKIQNSSKPLTESKEEEEKILDDRTPEEIKTAENTEIDDSLYSIKDFSI
ncbi:MAG: ParB/RepB/Spo0J family partition protein [Patescibacteria group bacterium]